ncbi:MAG: ribosomal-processing cysteine protease Prp [Bacillota bacterium]
MVRVELYKDDRNMVKSFRVEGHTGYADKGQDIICAGISAITQTALMGLLHYLEKKPVYKKEGGLLTCKLEQDLGDDDRLKAQSILGTMEIGLREIESQYKDFIQIRIRRC